jgi:hypothetical protein
MSEHHDHEHKHKIPADVALRVKALERLVTNKSLVETDELSDLESAWRKAYHDTPHGQPVTLDSHLINRRPS